MKAIGFTAPGSIDRSDALVDIELPAPQPGPRDLLVRVQAVSVNPVDTKVRSSAQPPQGEARVLGWDAAGIVEAVGAEVTLFRPGDAVFYAGELTRPGSNAELQAVDERLVALKPQSLGWAEAAAVPLTALTAWELLFERLRVPYGVKAAGGALLIVGGAGGVGSMLIQMARRLTGLTVIATASRPDTATWCLSLGAHATVDHRKPLAEELARIGIPQVGHIASLTATDRHLPAYAEIVAPQGHIAIIDDPATLDIVPFKRKSVTLAWELMYTRSLFRTPDMAEQHRILTEVAALLDAGVLRSTLQHRGGRICAADLIAAHKLQESGSAIGKTVLEGFS